MAACSTGIVNMPPVNVGALKGGSKNYAILKPNSFPTRPCWYKQQHSMLVAKASEGPIKKLGLSDAECEAAVVAGNVSEAPPVPPIPASSPGTPLISSFDFSILKRDQQCYTESTWTTMAFYIFSLHIPLSFGGLSIIAKVLHQNVIEPEIQAISLLVLQTLEFVAFILLLCFSEKSFNIRSFFEARVLPKERNWLLASVFGLVFLLAVVFLTSLVADKLIGPEDVNNPILKEILSGGPPSIIGLTLVYCVVTPLLEETVYRGFLLTSLALKMEWQKAVVISSVTFSATHLSIDNFLQLCVIGTVLGCSYCWTGTLISPFVIHSLYNAFILVITFIS